MSSNSHSRNSRAPRATTVNAAFLTEIKEVNLEMRAEIERILTICARPISLHSQTSELVNRLAVLLDHLALHFALEEAYGYFDDPEYVNAEFSDRVQSLRGQHASLYTQLCRLVDQAETLLRRHKLAALVTIVPLQFERFAVLLQNHEEAEMDLAQEAICADIGVGD